jgi:hypothetical protein
VVSGDPHPHPEPTAEQKMWAYWMTQRSNGRTPTGSELDRVFSTNNYGRGVLRKWRVEGRIPPELALGVRNGHRPAPSGSAALDCSG